MTLRCEPIPQATDYGFLNVRQARELCRGCPIRQTCLAKGVRTKGWGVFGGHVLQGGRPKRLNPGYKL